MYPAADPWDAPIDPTPALPTVPSTSAWPTVPSVPSMPTVPSTSPPATSTVPMYGRAQVPTHQPLRVPTTELPMLVPVDGRLPAPERVTRSAREVSYVKAGRASRRSLFDGWGFTATGLLVAFCGWGIWAAAGRGTLASPLTGLVIMLAVASGLFMLSRLLGRILFERILHRPRLHARWSHAFTGIFLAAAGISYLVNTTWLIDGVDWVRGQWQQI
jgi:hypothetical protein